MGISLLFTVSSVILTQASTPNKWLHFPKG